MGPGAAGARAGAGPGLDTPAVSLVPPLARDLTRHPRPVPQDDNRRAFRHAGSLTCPAACSRPHQAPTPGTQNDNRRALRHAGSLTCPAACSRPHQAPTTAKRQPACLSTRRQSHLSRRLLATSPSAHARYAQNDNRRASRHAGSLTCPAACSRPHQAPTPGMRKTTTGVPFDTPAVSLVPPLARDLTRRPRPVRHSDERNY